MEEKNNKKESILDKLGNSVVWKSILKEAKEKILRCRGAS